MFFATVINGMTSGAGIEFDIGWCMADTTEWTSWTCTTGVNDGVVSPSCSSIFLSAIIALTTPNVPAFLLSVERE